MNRITGANLMGGNSNYGRVENDYYATSPEATHSFLNIADLQGDSFYEPACGEGHISEVLKEFYPKATHYSSDLINRGYGEVLDFVEAKKKTLPKKVDWVMTNPPFSLASEFIHRSLKRSKKGVVMFLKIQFLETISRKELFDNTPLKYVYVHRKRQAIFTNGEPLNPKTGKKWANTICFAWYVWEHGYEGEPIIRWID